MEAFADESGDSKAVLEFLNHILAVGAFVIITPYPQGILFQRPARYQGLKEVFRQIEKFLPARTVSLLVLAVANQDQAACSLPTGSLINALSHFHAWHFGRLPLQLRAQQSLNFLLKSRHHHIRQPAGFKKLQQLGNAKPRIGPHPAQTDMDGKVGQQVVNKRDHIVRTGGVARP